MDDILGDFKTLLTEELTDARKETITNGNKAVEAKVNSGTSTMLRAYDAQQTKKFEIVQAELNAVDTRCSNIENDNKQMCTAIDKLKVGLVAAESKPSSRADVFPEDFDRKPDLAIIRINAATMVSKDAVATAIAAWLSDAELDDNSKCELSGPTLGTNYTIKCLDRDGLGTRRAKKHLTKTSVA